MNEPYCFLNGKIVPEKEASLPLSDIGILRAYAVYDGITAFNGKPFLFQNHYERFVRSAEALKIKISYTKEELYEALCEVLEKSGLTERANIRAVGTGGKTIAGIEFDPENSTVFFTAAKFSPLPEEYFTKGAKLITHAYQREFPEYKTVNYITGVMLQEKRKAAGAVEILYVSDEMVRECATSNIFIVKDGVLVSPKDKVLGGITRKLILSFADKEGLRHEERDVYVEEMMNADEVFITSSFKDVVPIVEIDGNSAGKGTVGPITSRMMALFKEYVASGVGLEFDTRL